MLFVCENPGCLNVDNTARPPFYAAKMTSRAGLLLCTECETGRWDIYGDGFPRRKYEPELHGPIGPGRIIDPHGRRAA